MARINNHLVIMAGGVGSRFWPMSTAEKPKQFIDVLGIGKSLLQLTVERFQTIVSAENVWVVTNKSYADTVAGQLPDMPRDHILCEPCRRNTAPCIAYVSWRIKSKDPKANIVVSPSDHVVMDVAEFRRVVTDCLKFTSESDAIVTLGMKPTRPETGYGYIEANLSANSLRNKEIFRVDSFREKPDLKTAQQYISKNNYFWNAGIFIWNVSTIVNAFRIYQPSIAKLFESLLPIYGTEKEQEIIDQKFPECENISVDYAIMEKAEEIFVCPADFGWSDLGTWVRCTNSRRKTSTAMPASDKTSPSSSRTTASSTPRRRRKWSFKDLMVISWLKTTTLCSFANSPKNSASSSSADKDNVMFILTQYEKSCSYYWYYWSGRFVSGRILN